MNDGFNRDWVVGENLERTFIVSNSKHLGVVPLTTF